jgi:hypothetical protein
MHFSAVQRFFGLSKGRSPCFFFVAVALSIFTAEVLVMFFSRAAKIAGGTSAPD